MKGTHAQLMAKKGAILDELRDKFERASIIIFTDYRGEKSGLSVKDISALRRSLREHDVEYKIAKNTLILKVLKEKGIEGFDKYLENPTAVVIGYGDPVAAAKGLVAFTKEKKTKDLPDGMPLIKGAWFDKEEYDAAGVRHLATLPSRTEVLAQLLSLLNSPAQKVMGIMQASGRDLLSILDQKSKQS